MYYIAVTVLRRERKKQLSPKYWNEQVREHGAIDMTLTYAVLYSAVKLSDLYGNYDISMSHYGLLNFYGLLQRKSGFADASLHLMWRPSHPCLGINAD